MEELNCKTVFELPVLGGISESVVVTWIIMAVLVGLSLILVRNLKVENPGKVQLALEAAIDWATDFFEGILGKGEQKIYTVSDHSSSLSGVRQHDWSAWL